MARIIAIPNPVVLPLGKTTGKTRIRWNTQDSTVKGEVWLVDGLEEKRVDSPLEKPGEPPPERTPQHEFEASIELNKTRPMSFDSTPSGGTARAEDGQLAVLVFANDGKVHRKFWDGHAWSPPRRGWETLERPGIVVTPLPEGPESERPPRDRCGANHFVGTQDTCEAGTRSTVRGPAESSAVDQHTPNQSKNRIGVKALRVSRRPSGRAMKLALVLGVLASASVPIMAAVVTSTADSGLGSLREALGTAPVGDTIRFDLSLPNVIALTSGELVIPRDLTVEGPGADQLQIFGNFSSRVFRIDAGATVTLSGLTITGGFVQGVNGANGTQSQDGGNGQDAYGGGIYNAGHLILSHCTVSDNAAIGGSGGKGGDFVNDSGIPGTGRGGNGGAARGGGLFVDYATGSLRIIHCTLSHNVAQGGDGGAGGDGNDSDYDGGAGGNGGDGAGGGFHDERPFLLHSVTVSGNRASGGNGGAGGMSGTGIARGGNGGAGGSGTGGGIRAFLFQEIIQCTIAVNEATMGLGGAAGPGVRGNPNGVQGINGGGSGGGLIGYFFAPVGDVLNAVFADNRASTGAPDVSYFVSSLGHNFVSNGDGSTGWIASDTLGTTLQPLNAMLDPLQDNGGPMPTHLPRKASPLFEGADNIVLKPPYSITTDQRGGRRRAGASVDIGTVEVGAFVRLTSIRDAGSQFDLSFTTEAGWSYQLESVDALPALPAAWLAVPGTSVIGTGGVMTVSDARPRSATNRYYRVALSP